jgi:hypothetical protein
VGVFDGCVSVLSAQAAPTRDRGVGFKLAELLIEQTQHAFAHQLVSVVGDGVTHHARCDVKVAE